MFSNDYSSIIIRLLTIYSLNLFLVCTCAAEGKRERITLGALQILQRDSHKAINDLIFDSRSMIEIEWNEFKVV